MKEKHLNYAEALALSKQQDYEKNPKLCKYCGKAVSYAWSHLGDKFSYCNGTCEEKYEKIEIKAQKRYKIKYRLRKSCPCSFHPQSSVKKSTVFSETIGVLSGKEEAIREWQKPRLNYDKIWVILSVKKVKAPRQLVYGGNHVLGFRDKDDGQLYQ